MLDRLFGSKKKDEMVKAKEDFEAVCRLRGDAREVQVARIRMALRCRSVIDKTFLEGIEKWADHTERCMVAVVTDEPRPEPPRASSFQKIKTINGEVMAFIPLDAAEEIFALGGLYQKEQISDEHAIELAQQVASRISEQLNLDKPIQPLGFLSEKLEEDRAAADMAKIREARARASASPAMPPDPKTNTESAGDPTAQWRERAGL